MCRNKVIFVCTANRLRSVMAEYIMKDLLVKWPITGVIPEDVCSAGIIPDGVWELFPDSGIG